MQKVFAKAFLCTLYNRFDNRYTVIDFYVLCGYNRFNNWCEGEYLIKSFLKDLRIVEPFKEKSF